ncbi:Ribonuclease R [Candidatus Hepatincolaceae symbiont of Richtersius coronifer]
MIKDYNNNQFKLKNPKTTAKSKANPNKNAYKDDTYRESRDSGSSPSSSRSDRYGANHFTDSRTRSFNKKPSFGNFEYSNNRNSENRASENVEYGKPIARDFTEDFRKKDFSNRSTPGKSNFGQSRFGRSSFGKSNFDRSSSNRANPGRPRFENLNSESSPSSSNFGKFERKPRDNNFGNFNNRTSSSTYSANFKGNKDNRFDNDYSRKDQFKEVPARSEGYNGGTENRNFRGNRTYNPKSEQRTSSSPNYRNTFRKDYNADHRNDNYKNDRYERSSDNSDRAPDRRADYYTPGNSRPFSRNQDNEKQFGKSHFSNNKYSENRNNFGKGFNSGSHPENTPSRNNTISLEFVIGYLAKNRGIINLFQATQDLQLRHKDADDLYSKINLLKKANVLIQTSKDGFTLNGEKIANETLPKYGVLKVKKRLLEDHYLCTYSALLKGESIEDEFIIINLNTTLLNKNILVELLQSGEKILASPLYYLDHINTLNTYLPTNNLNDDQHNAPNNFKPEVYNDYSSNNDASHLRPLQKDYKNILANQSAHSFNDNAPNDPNIIKGVYQIYDNQNFLVPINYKSRNNIILNHIPPTLEPGILIKAKLDHNSSYFNESGKKYSSDPYVRGKIDSSKYIQATFIEVIAEEKLAKAASLLSVHQYDLPYEFPKEVIKEAQSLGACGLENRKDIRHLPLVTIDDEDAKDFDDAIYAEKILDKEGSYKAYIAIADVSHYVTPKSSLDKEAQLRGNSVYLPGLVIPMLPHELSNGWCSLNPDEDRGCLLAEVVINKNGEIEDYAFSRCLMKSRARLTYNQVQQALDSSNSLDNLIPENIKPIMDTVIKPIYECFQLLNTARKKRKALEIVSQETKIILDKEDNVLEIKIRKSTIAHKIVEEFMIAANVATAKMIAKAGLAQQGLGMYRVHDRPSLEKVMEFIKVLKTFKINAKLPEVINGEFFNQILQQNASEYFSHALNEATLRSQMQAIYDNINIGHFGLGLKEYCHFTSPIRRYSDLMIHRLILFILDDKNSFNYNRSEVSTIAQHISLTERVAFHAENSAKDRLLARWLATKIGEKFEAYISTITHAGMFINLLESGASGLLPVRMISSGYSVVNLDANTIRDNNGNITYTLGDQIEAFLVEADPIRGSLIFSIIDPKSNSMGEFKRLRSNFTETNSNKSPSKFGKKNGKKDSRGELSLKKKFQLKR